MLRSIKILSTVAVFGILSIIGLVFYSFSLTSDKIDYNRDVKPIINKKCISCHGGVKKQGGFSFLFEEEAKAQLKSGAFAIVPFKPNQSEIINRITSPDEAERMPYKHDALSKEEIKIFTDWIKQGAKWGIHWSYIPVKSPEIPAVKSPWIKNDIDRYILKKLKSEKLNTSGQAPPAILARRVAAAFLTVLRRLVRTLGITGGDMEKGQLRCVANVSLRPVGQQDRSGPRPN